MSLRRIDQALAAGSYYAASAPAASPRPALDGDVRCDVAIVGGGLAGLSAALELAQRGYSVRLLEAGEIGGGASGRNGGQAIHGLACEQDVIEAQLGLADARRVWDMTIEALDLLRQRMHTHAIECDWRSGYLGLATTVRKGRALAAWAERTESVYGYPLQRISPAEVGDWIGSPRYHSGVHDPRSGHLHPLKYTRGLAEAAAAAGAQLHEHSAVLTLQPGQPLRLHTARGTLRAEQVLLAGNVYLDGLAAGLAPAMAARIMPVGTYIACTEPLAPDLARSLIPSGAAVCDTNFVLDYFRPTPDHRLLYGGRVSYSTATPPRLAQQMAARMRHTFPRLAARGAAADVAYAWGGFVDITMNRAPDFGRWSDLARAGAGDAVDNGQNIYYLQGFSGHGLALTGLAGRLVAEAMDGDARRFDVFARLRHRPFPGGRWLRTPALVLGMAWYRMRDLLG